MDNMTHLKVDRLQLTREKKTNKNKKENAVKYLYLKVEVKYLYLYWITLSATLALLPIGPVRVIPHGSSVSTGGNRSNRKEPAMLGRVKLDNTLLTCDQGNFNQITARSQNQTLVIVVRDTCTITVTPALPEAKN